MTDATNQIIANTMESLAKAFIKNIVPIILLIAGAAVLLHRVTELEGDNRQTKIEVQIIRNDSAEMKTDIRWIKQYLQNEQRRNSWNPSE
jgi:hypothetical protein